MPPKLERKLKRIARRRHYGKKRTGAYVYGTIYNLEHGGRRKARKPRAL